MEVNSCCGVKLEVGGRNVEGVGNAEVVVKEAVETETEMEEKDPSGCPKHRVLTRGRCFLCFKKIPRLPNGHRPDFVSIRSVLRYLNVNYREELKTSSDSDVVIAGIGDDVTALLCQFCSRYVDQMTELLRQREKIDLENAKKLQVIKGRVRHGFEREELRDSLGPRPFRSEGEPARKLRAAILKGCDKMERSCGPRVLLHESKKAGWLKEDQEVTQAAEPAELNQVTSERVKGPLTVLIEKLPKELVICKSVPVAKLESQVTTSAVPGAAPKYKCIFCDKRFFSWSGRCSHVNSIHRGIRYKCDGCNESYRSKFNLDKHKKNKRCLGSKRAVATATTIKSRSGRGRPKQAKSRTSLKFRVTKDGMYRCKHPRCSKTLASSLGIISHYNSTHLQIKHKCSVCKRAFISKAYATAHKSICGGRRLRRPGKKRIVEKIQKGRLEALLKRKKKRSSNGFTCKICGRKFNSIGMVTAHRRQFHKLQPKPKPKGRKYICDLCGKEFPFSEFATFQRHRRLKHFAGFLRSKE